MHWVSKAVPLVMTQSLTWGNQIAVKKFFGGNLFLVTGPKIFLQGFIFCESGLKLLQILPLIQEKSRKFRPREFFLLT